MYKREAIEHDTGYVRKYDNQVTDASLLELDGWETGDTERSRWEDIVVEDLSLSDLRHNDPFPGCQSSYCEINRRFVQRGAKRSNAG